jgi:anti-sigma B factor antagonist
VCVIEVEGEVDMLTAPALAQVVREDGSFDALVLDLAKVSFVSLAGMRLIASLYRRLSRRGGGVALAAVQHNVARVLEISGLAEAVLIADDVPAAIRLLVEPVD